MGDVRKLATENDELKSESKIYQLHKMVVEESEEMKSNLYLHQQRLLEVEKENNKMRKYKDQSEEIKSMQMKIQSQNQDFNLKKEQLLTEINELKFGCKMHQLNQMMSAEVTRLKSSLFTEQQVLSEIMKYLLGATV